MENPNDDDDNDSDGGENPNEVLAREIMEGKRRVTTRVLYRNRILQLTSWIKD